MFRNTCLLIILLSSIPVCADDLSRYKKIITDSLTSFESSGRKDWAYRLKTEQGQGDKKVTFLETFDPSQAKDNQWQLLKEYGKQPSNNRIAEYQDQKKAEQTIEQQSGVQNLIDMLTLDSLNIIQRKGDMVSLSFSPKIANMDLANQAKLFGKIVVDLRKRHVVSMKISNIEPIKPAPQVTLDYFAMSLSFIAFDKVLLPSDIEINIAGKMNDGRKINQHSVANYSHYRNITSPH